MFLVAAIQILVFGFLFNECLGCLLGGTGLPGCGKREVNPNLISAFSPSHIVSPLDVVGSRWLLPLQGPGQHRSDRLHKQWEGVEADEPSA